MFTKEIVLKAFKKINNHPMNRKYILENRKDKKQNPDAYMKKFNEALVSDDLITYLNSHADYVPAIAFENIEDLGEFGKILSECKKIKEMLPLASEIKEPIPLVYPQKRCIVGSDGASGGVDQMVEHMTYIFEDGAVAVIERTSYGVGFGGEEDDDISAVFMLQCISLIETPLLNDIDEEFFDEEYQEYWET